MKTRKAAAEQAHGPRRIKSIETGFRVLRVLQEAEGKLALSEIALRSGMHASNVYLYLASFVYEGIVEQDPRTSHYGLGAAAIQLGAAALRQSSLIDLAKAPLTRLREQTRNSVMLSVWGNRGPTVVFKIDGETYGVLGIRVGHVMPLLTSATGRVFLAHLDAAHWQGLVEGERQANISLGGRPDESVRFLRLDEITRSVLTQGLACMSGEGNARYPSSAAPVFDQQGLLCGVVTMLLHRTGSEGNVLDSEVNQALTQTTRQISKNLGYTPAAHTSTLAVQPKSLSTTTSR